MVNPLRSFTIRLCGALERQMSDSSKVKTRQCAYCGEFKAQTRDHIPPKGLFPKPLPSDLITVPCCEECRAGGSQDDEYFRAVLLAADNLENDPRAQKQIDIVSRSLRNPKKIGFGRMISRSLSEVEITTKAGIILGRKPAFKFDRERVNNVLGRIVRALFFREFSYPVPKDCPVATRLDQFGEFSNKLSSIGGFQPIRFAADNMFLYTFLRAVDNPNATFWLGTFFEQVSFAGYTGLKKTSSIKT